MRIALIKETKIPVDNRVALSPRQVAELNKRFPGHKIVVQASDVRVFSDDEYRAEGVPVVSRVDDCDILFGIKEAKIESLIPNKRYFFFGHIAKMQEYNRPLLQAFIQKHITFCDYEYLVDDNNIRVCAFGWWAGVVGVYYTLRGYGLNGNGDGPAHNQDGNSDIYDKLVSNVQEIRARQGRVMAVVTEGDTEVVRMADCYVEVPRVSECLSPILNIVPLQLLSYYVACLKGCNVDQPRNLAKSVTVE